MYWPLGPRFLKVLILRGLLFNIIFYYIIWLNKKRIKFMKVRPLSPCVNSRSDTTIVTFMHIKDFRSPDISRDDYGSAICNRFRFQWYNGKNRPDLFISPDGVAIYEGTIKRIRNRDFQFLSNTRVI